MSTRQLLGPTSLTGLRLQLRLKGRLYGSYYLHFAAVLRTAQTYDLALSHREHEKKSLPRKVRDPKP